MANSRLAHDIILRPVVTERSMMAVGDKKFTFEVAKNANKIEIAQAVEEVFPGTEVKKVNTMSVRGKRRRQGMTQGFTKSWKKAIVTLTEDSKTIEFFESMI